MANTEETIRGFIEKGRLKEAAKVVESALQGAPGELSDELIVWRAELRDLETQSRRGFVDQSSYSKERRQLAYKLLDLFRAHEPDREEPPGIPVAPPLKRPADTPRVFLSYSRKDLEASLAVRASLKAAGIHIEMDIDAMQPGEPIKDFIQRAIRATSATIGILSEQSLLSEWVAQETMLSLLTRDLWQDRSFVACFLDTRFLDLTFRRDATDLIDERILKIGELQDDYGPRQLDPIDLNAQKTRLFALRNGLGDILAQLRATLCLDIRAEARETSLAQLAAHLTKQHAGTS